MNGLKKGELTMKRFCSFLSALTITISATSFQPASAQMATELTQLANKVLLGQQLSDQSKQLQNEISQLANLVLNTNSVPAQIWGTAIQDFNQLKSLLQQSQSLAYTASNLDQQFATKYGTYNTYLAETMTATDWNNKYSEWSTEASNNALTAYKTLGLQASQLSNDQAVMQQLQALAGSAQGRMEALQVANMMAAQNVSQIQKLQQLMMSQLQMQADYLAMQQDKEAAHEANRVNLYTNWKNTPDTDGQVF
jgi:P-type conjugative transfer protein TrbJ